MQCYCAWYTYTYIDFSIIIFHCNPVNHSEENNGRIFTIKVQQQQLHFLMSHDVLYLTVSGTITDLRTSPPWQHAGHMILMSQDIQYWSLTKYKLWCKSISGTNVWSVDWRRLDQSCQLYVEAAAGCQSTGGGKQRGSRGWWLVDQAWPHNRPSLPAPAMTSN